ncbi:hypothetical protein HJA85_25695 [Rhizobium bangladeshense]|uniref:hypothetical protein n=1 Tax=Rhizobium bangladeshense TaxID=1138189 RepID=UPI001C835AD5|nr:hypothetical protein [Rhizobium bangladeshense]MBX4870323.1 hypothetical protein [Rhizobium bangladeshense]
MSKTLRDKRTMLDVVDKNLGWVAETKAVIDWLNRARGQRASVDTYKSTSSKSPS